MKKHELPKMETTFDIQLNGNETNLFYPGQFTYKRPSLGARSNIDVMHKRLNGDLSTLDDDTYKFNEAVSYLRFTLTAFPDWWKECNYGHDLYDSNVVVEVYNKCMDYEKEFLSALHSTGGAGIEKGVENAKAEATQ